MTLIFNAVLSIKPISVEAERTFSTCTSGNCATKIRSRLGNRRVNPTANGRHLKRASRRNGDNYSYLFAYMPIGKCCCRLNCKHNLRLWTVFVYLVTVSSPIAESVCTHDTHDVTAVC